MLLQLQSKQMACWRGLPSLFIIDCFKQMYMVTQLTHRGLWVAYNIKTHNIKIVTPCPDGSSNTLGQATGSAPSPFVVPWPINKASKGRANSTKGIMPHRERATTKKAFFRGLAIPNRWHPQHTLFYCWVAFSVGCPTKSTLSFKLILSPVLWKTLNHLLIF